jgi:hypothetical protein
MPEVTMKRAILLCVATVLAVAAPLASATFHLFAIEQVYSNADGTVQFVVLSTFTNGEHLWAGRALTSTGAQGTKRYTFPANLPGSGTAGRKVLVATEGFAALGLVTPDYVIPNHFIATGAGSVDFAEVSALTYKAGQLPTDGTNALFADGTTGRNLATNFARQSASVVAAAPSRNYEGLWWNSPAESESGWGINFAHQGDVIFATWFTYDTDGEPLWLSATATKNAAGVYTGTLYRTSGAAFSAVPWDGKSVALTAVGTLTLTFAHGNSAAFAYTVNGVSQSKQITRQVFRAPGTMCH